MSNRRLATSALTALCCVLVASVAYWLWDHRHHWTTRNFRVVEPGRVVAGGYQHPIPLRDIVKRHHIKTVLSLLTEDERYSREEREVLAATGVSFRHMPIPYGVSLETKLASVEEAVAFVSDPANQPVLVHCWGGKHRTGAVVAVYRVRNNGWSEAAARAELLRYGGAEENTRWPSELLKTYCARSAKPEAPISKAAPAQESSRF